MEIKDMNMEQLQARKTEIRGLIATATEEEINGFNAELDQIEAREAAIKEAAEKRRGIAQRVAGGAGMQVGTFQGAEQHQQTAEEIRNSKAYIDAYAEYVRTGNDAECRTLMTTQNNDGHGTVAVPEFVYDIVKTAWESNDLLRFVRKTYFPGNLKVNYEFSGSDAIMHMEGDAAVEEEELVLGTVELIPRMAKKWIGISREAMSLRGEEFLRYIYDELTYRIMKVIAEALQGRIFGLSSTPETVTHPLVPITTAPISVGSVAQALGNLSADATNPVVILHRTVWGAIKALQHQAGYAADPFEGCTVVFSNNMPAYSTIGADKAYMIVGDPQFGAIANFPNGEDVHFVFDEYSQKKSDIVEILGEMYVAIEVVNSNAFTLVKTPEA